MTADLMQRARAAVTPEIATAFGCDGAVMEHPLSPLLVERAP